MDKKKTQIFNDKIMEFLTPLEIQGEVLLE